MKTELPQELGCYSLEGISNLKGECLGWIDRQSLEQSERTTIRDAIVLRYNAHEKLVEALESCKRVFEGWCHDANPHGDLKLGESADFDAAVSMLGMVCHAIALSTPQNGGGK